MKCECGMRYVPENRQDVRAHRQHHDEWVNGEKAGPLKSDEEIYHQGGFRVTLVGPTAPFVQHNRARKVALRANLETRFDFGVYHQSEKLDEHAFLGHHGSRATALLIMERRSHIWRAAWADMNLVKQGSILYNGDPNWEPEKISDDADWWTVCYAWMLSKYRGQGLATQLLECAAHWVDVPIQELAWLAPFTEPGMHFIKRHCPDEFLLGR